MEVENVQESIKEEIIDAIVMKVSMKVGVQYKDVIQNICWETCKDIDIVTKSKDIVVYNHDNEVLVKKWAANKMLEGLSRNSIAYYLTIVRGYLSYNNQPLIQTTTEDVKTYLAIAMTTGISGKPMSKVSADNARRVLSSFFTWMEEEEILVKNPMRRVKRIKQQKLRKEAFTYAEIEKIRSACSTVRDRALIEFLLSTACRCAEVSTAKLSQLQHDGTLKIIGKGSKERLVYLNEVAQLKLQEYLNTRDDAVDAIFLREKKVNGEYKSITTNGIESAVRKIGEKAGVDNCHPHRFRRTAATWASKRGMKLEHIQRMLGHEEINTTLIYAQVDDADVKASHERYL